MSNFFPKGVEYMENGKNDLVSGGMEVELKSEAPPPSNAFSNFF